MKAAILITTLLIFFTDGRICYAGWTFQKELGGMKYEISDEKTEFDVDGMKCGAEKTLFTRNPNDSVSEARQLYCWTSPDTYVATFVNCDLPYHSSQALQIRKEGKFFQPALTCGPNVKK